MIDRIEFAMLDKIEQVGNLDNENSVLLEKQRNAINEAAKICDMREDVVGEENIRPLSLLQQLLRQPQGEEGVERVDAPLERRGSRSLRRVNAQNRNVPGHEMPQQVPVVGSGFDNQAFGSEPARLHKLLSASPEMLLERGRHR